MVRKQYHHGNLKKAIIQEALRQLKSVGPEKLSFREVAKNLKVVSSAPYNHFNSKKELYSELIKIGKEVLLDKMNSEKNKNMLPAEKLFQSAKAYLNFSLEEKELFSLMFSANNLELRDLINTISLQFLDIVREKFKDGKRMRITEKGASITAWSMVHGLAKLVSNENLNTIESQTNLKIEEIFTQMSAIWGKGVSN